MTDATATQFKAHVRNQDTTTYVRQATNPFNTTRETIYVGIEQGGNTQPARDLANEYGADTVEFLGGTWELEVTFQK